MAESKNNVITHGLSGKIGNLIVFRNVKGKTIVANRPIRSGKVSESQAQHLRLFQEAVIYAKAALADESTREAYAEKAQKSGKILNAYNIAIADFLQAPDIKEIDLSKYQGHAGDKISIAVTDDFRVKEVSVAIWNADGVQVESGQAAPEANGLNWSYTAQVENASLTGDKIVVRASDMPGNISEMEKVM